VQSKAKAEPAAPAKLPVTNLGETLFGVKPSNSAANPFAMGSSSMTGNPFTTVPRNPAPANNDSTAATATSPSATLPETFAQKARLSAAEEAKQQQESSKSSTKTPLGPPEPWPAQSSFPKPFPRSNIECETEYISRPTSDNNPSSSAQVTNADGEATTTTSLESAFESSMDKTFQRFADRLSQNPEQILRYEWQGQPLLYSKSDAIGKLLSPTSGSSSSSIDGRITTTSTSSGLPAFSARVPRCGNCRAKREFEMQITPFAILELESGDDDDDVGLLDGMDWGTILVGACVEDCAEQGRKADEVGYVEEWVGVQWEELVVKGRK
jgi:pre-rRNA-processing protein TSR4